MPAQQKNAPAEKPAPDPESNVVEDEAPAPPQKAAPAKTKAALAIGAVPKDMALPAKVQAGLGPLHDAAVTLIAVEAMLAPALGQEPGPLEGDDVPVRDVLTGRAGRIFDMLAKAGSGR